jgi:hypothetical protein
MLGPPGLDLQIDALVARKSLRSLAHTSPTWVPDAIQPMLLIDRRLRLAERIDTEGEKKGTACEAPAPLAQELSARSIEHALKLPLRRRVFLPIALKSSGSTVSRCPSPMEVSPLGNRRCQRPARIRPLGWGPCRSLSPIGPDRSPDPGLAGAI